MATFIWPPEVQWPPPANILLNYDVVAPGGVETLSWQRAIRGEKPMSPQFALIVPLGGDAGGPGVSPPIYHPGHPDHGLPSAPGHPWLPGHIGGRPGVSPPIYHPGHPDHGLPPGGGHVSPPIYHPGHPDHGLPSAPGHPSTGPVYPPGQPDQGLPPGTPVTINPPLPPPPGDLAQQIIIAVYKPGEGWKAQSYPPPTTAPTPHKK
jgi:hypothetical protein